MDSQSLYHSTNSPAGLKDFALLLRTFGGLWDLCCAVQSVAKTLNRLGIKKNIKPQ